MRVLDYVAFGLFVLITSPAFAAEVDLDCGNSTTGQYSGRVLENSEADYFITTTDEFGAYIVLDSIFGENRHFAKVKFEGKTILTVTSAFPTDTAYVSDVVTGGRFTVSTHGIGQAIVRFMCVPGPINQMQAQAQSSFVQTNMASSGVAFDALLDGMDVGETGGTEPIAFSPDAARATEAIQAIDGTFSLLGYGPNALLSGDATLARGEDWRIKGIVKGRFAEADVTGGKLTQTEGTASLLVSGWLNADLRYALSITGGLGKANAPGQSDTSHKILLAGAVALPIDSALDLIVGANWGTAHHEVDLGPATGSYAEQMASASMALRGEQNYGAVTLVPMLVANFGYGSVPDFTDSAAASHAGSTSLIASADAGLKVSYDFVVDANRGTLISPFAGVTLSAYRQSFDENGGASTVSTGLGTELELGVKSDLPGGAKAGLSGTLGRRGDTTSASISGSLSGAF